MIRQAKFLLLPEREKEEGEGEEEEGEEEEEEEDDVKEEQLMSTAAIDDLFKSK